MTHKTLVLGLLLLALAGTVALGAQQLTIYTQGLACVTETRSVTVAAGTSTVDLPMPAQLVPESMSIGVDATILWQAYHYTPAGNLLASSIGQKIQVITADAAYRGVLLASDSNGITLKEDSGTIRQVRNPEAISFLDDQPAISPVLEVSLSRKDGGKLPVSLSYLTGGVSWSADYVGMLSADETTLALQANVSLSNKSGADFKDAAITLVAGAVNVVPKTTEASRAAPMALVADQAFSAQQAFEYHSYTLTSSLDLPNGASLIVPYTAGTGIPVTKHYTYDGAQAQGVAVSLSFENKEADGLGIPLPAGTVRVFQLGTNGTLFLGEDTIGHTPVDGEVTLGIGSAFDLTGTRTQVSREKVSSTVYRETYKITLKNAKDAAVSIDVLEHPNGTWKVLSSTQPYTQVDANTIRFTLEVPAHGEKDVTYTVEYSY